MTDAIVTPFPSPATGEATRKAKAAERKRRSRAKQRKQVQVVNGGVSKSLLLNHSTVTPVTPPVTRDRHVVDVAAYCAAVALASAAAWFSIRGMVVLFPGSPMSVVGMAIAMESAKLVTAGWLARRWNETRHVWRLSLISMITGLAAINAAGVYAQLVAAHVGERALHTAVGEMQIAEIGGKLELAAAKVADLDRRLNQIDSAIEESTRRGKTKTAIATMEGQRKARQSLVDERQSSASALAALKTERAQVTARGRQVDAEAAPIRYVAELLGVDGDSERAIRWLIALMVLCCDPLAIALTAAASARCV